jgi:hypothetical protein
VSVLALAALQTVVHVLFKDTYSKEPSVHTTTGSSIAWTTTCVDCIPTRMQIMACAIACRHSACPITGQPSRPSVFSQSRLGRR